MLPKLEELEVDPVNAERITVEIAKIVAGQPIADTTMALIRCMAIAAYGTALDPDTERLCPRAILETAVSNWAMLVIEITLDLYDAKASGAMP